MRHNTKTASIDFSYLAVLLLLAYVLSSAPRYVRQLKENKEDIKIEKMSPLKEVLKLGKYYGVDPYLRAWNRLTPGNDEPAKAKPAANLAIN
ncbi:MAG: hypothetical protein JNK79_08560 [Chitinophagaceae bacterium]|nr:hypothetical protein [Chitinophagaceae bacterium]